LKDKHINITQDSNLLREVYKEVENKLHVDKQATATLLTVKFVFYFSLVILSYSAIYFSTNKLTLFSAYILFGLLSILFGFNFAHDFCHNTVFKNKQLNNFGFIFIYTLLGAHAEAWKFRHIHSHHYAPNVTDYDTDLQITSFIRVEPASEYKWFHKYQQFYAPLAYSTYSLFWVFIKDFVVYFTNKENNQKKEFSFHASFWFQKLFYTCYLLILPILFSNLAWFIVALAFISMHLIQSLFLLFTFFITHHVEQTEYFNADEDGYIKTSWLTNQIKSSNDFHPFSQTANFIFGGFNNHVAHHLFPHIHHVHYPQLNKILYKVLNENNIKPNVTTFIGGIVSHLRHLKNLSAQP
jgi:linoleoyl-CoA desaturase